MKEKLIQVVKNALIKMKVTDVTNIEVSKSNTKENGDYSTNVAMKLAKVLRKNPMEIASSIKDNITDDDILNIEIKAPGFINFFVKKDYLLDNINNVLNLKDKYGSSNIGNNKKINIEFVSANPTGILHIGNARGGAYGDSLARIMKFSGFDVTKEYYINDAGVQIDNLGLSILARYKEQCGLEAEMPKGGYFGKDIIEIAKELYKKYGDTYLDKEVDYFKKLGTKIMLGHIVDDLK